MMQLTDEQINTFVAGLALPSWHREHVANELRALLSASKPAAPQGWKLVPVEPTEEILSAIFRNERDARRAWRDALAATPAAPAQSVEPIYQILDPIEGSWSDCGRGPYDATDGAFRRIVYAAPQPSLPAQVGEAFVPYYEGVEICNTCKATRAAPAAVAQDERAALLADHIELNLCNYDPDDVASLNAWAIRAYDFIDRAASPQARAAASAQASVPADVMAALDRMCTPLDESVLKGATAQADAHSMKVIREYVLRTPSPDGAQKDAERYRWLRDFDIRCKDGVNINPPCEHVHASMYSHAVGTIPAVRLVTGAELDHAIDAAIEHAASAGKEA